MVARVEKTSQNTPMAKKIKINPGEEWIGVICRNVACGRTILIEKIEPEMRDENDVVTVRLENRPISCPFCKSELVYRSEEAKRFQAQRYQ